MTSLVAASAPASAAAAAARTCAQGSKGTTINYNNIDNDRAHEPDPVVGDPKAGPGAVDVYLDPFQGRVAKRYRQGSFSGLPAGGAGDEFGAAVTYELGHSPCTGVAIGAPGTEHDRGAVVTVPGGVHGLAKGHAVRIVGRTPGERFGTALAWYHYQPPFPDLLAVGAPNRTVHGKAQAGAVYLYQRTNAGGWKFLRMITADTKRIPGSASAGAHFGAVLSGGFTIGAPDDTVAGVRGAGSVTVISGVTKTYRVLTAQRLTQGGLFPGRPQRGDAFGAAIAGGGGSVAIGVPGDPVHGHRAAGRVEYFDDSNPSRHLRFKQSFTQDSPDVEGIAETGDRFGASIAQAGYAAYCIKDGAVAGASPVMIGSPGEDIGDIKNAGAVSILATIDPAPHNPVCGKQWTQHPGGYTALTGRSQTGDRLGQTVRFLFSTERYDSEDGYIYVGEPTFVIGVPGENTGHGGRDAGRIILSQPFRHAGPRDISRTAVGGGNAGDSYGAVLPGSN